MPALFSLLQDESLMVTENLVLNKDYPMSMYIPSDGKVGEANSGSRYRELYNELAQGKNQLLVPIIMYLDGTAIDSKGHIEICPVSFTTSLFTEKARRDVKAWRLMGYVPDLNHGRSGAMNSFANASAQEKGRTTRNFHKVMDVMMAGWAKGQAGLDDCLQQVPLKLGDRWFVVEVVCPFYLSSMMASKVINFVAESMAITAVHCVTTVHVIVCMKILILLKFCAHSYQLIQSTMYLDLVHKRIVVSFQSINVTMRSTAFRWGRIPTASSCVLSLMLCIPFSMASSCTFLIASREASMHSHLQS